MVQRMGSGDRQHPSIRALLSNTGQVSQSLFFLICEMGMMVLCHRIAVTIGDNEFEVPGGCDGFWAHQPARHVQGKAVAWPAQSAC